MTNDSTWSTEIFHVLKQAHIRQASYVPDAGHGQLIELLSADPEIQTTPLTTEEEGVALAAGAWLGGATRGAAAAIERRRKLHQHAVAGIDLPISVAHAGHDARRMG